MYASMMSKTGIITCKEGITRTRVPKIVYMTFIVGTELLPMDVSTYEREAWIFMVIYKAQPMNNTSETLNIEKETKRKTERKREL